jgi:penicillin-binding protein 2
MKKNIKKDTKIASSWQKALLSHSDKINSKTKLEPTLYLKGILWVLVLVLCLRLFQLQIVEGSTHLKRAEDNRIITKRIAASRGVIRDRNGEVLTRNIPTYKKLKSGTTLAQGQFETISKEEAQNSQTTGGTIFYDISREYLFDKVMAPVIGYINEASLDDLNDLDSDYFPGDLIGQSGVEKSFQSNLRGTPGLEYIEISSDGSLQRVIGKINPIVGSDIVLSIDLGLQKALYQALEGYSGAGVAINPQNGEILALVSRPTYNPNNIAEYLESEDLPFFNRAISGAYPPGSIYKPITLTAGLEENQITSDDTIEDTGEIIVNEFRFGNWLYDRTGGTEGLVNAIKALQRSNDIYFYKLGERIGVESLAEWSRLFGLGSKTNISLPGEIDGLVPDPLWKERTTGDRWYLGNTYHMAIGQGDLQVTPIQMATALSVIANQGRLCTPQIIKDGQVLCKELGISSETISIIKEGMIAVCQPGGTASRWSSFLPQVACKTGTAQFGGSESVLSHAWFTVFAPAENSEILLVILLEGAGEGSEFASPVAMEVLKYWFNR